MTLELDLARLRSLDGIKWAKHAGTDVLAAWVADMDLPPAPMAVDAVRALVDRGDFGYNHRGHDLLPEAFVAWQARRHGWTPPVEQVRVFCDVLHALETAIVWGTDPGDGILLCTPTYPPFLDSIDGAGRQVVPVPLERDHADGPWRLTEEAIDAAIAGHDGPVTAFLVCNPHNPTGRVFDDDELEVLLGACERHDLLVLADEIWADLTHGGAHVALAPRRPGRIVVATAASKTFNLAGLRCAAAVIDDDRVATALDALPSHALGAVSSPGADATLACWNDGDDWASATARHLTEQRDHLAARLAAEAPSVRWSVPDATYLAWLDVAACGLGQDPAATLLERGRVAFNSGLDFGPGGASFVRLNLASSRPMLDAVVDRFVGAIS